MANAALPSSEKTSAETTVATGRFYRPELDGLRFLSFLVVFISHAYLISPRMFAGSGPMMAEVGRWALAAGHCGYAAVAVFFVLSSYLITELLLREHDRNGKLDVPAFYARRALRIWPLYFFFLILMLIVEPRLGMPGIPAADVPWYLAFLGNWQIVWNGQIPRSAAQILWTVSIEEQFYLIWPLLIALVSPKRLGWMCAALLVFGQITRGVMVASGSPFYAIHFHTCVQFDAIAWGGLLAVAMRNGVFANWPVVVRRGMFFGGAVLAVVTQRCLAEDKPFAAWPMAAYPLFAIAALMIVAGVMRTSEQESSWLTHPWLARLGKISYGLYVWHLFAILLTYKFGWCRPQSVWTSLYALPMTIAMAEISYQWIEKPFLRWKEHFSRTEVPATSAVHLATNSPANAAAAEI
jgi:peptidoglycan/LPS O-acetylase OafA/YrhL